MKNLILAIFILGCTPVFAQKMNASKVPAPAKEALSKNFPAVTEVKWEKENGNFEANFKQDNHKVSVVYNAAGVWIETEIAMEIGKLPQPVTDYIAKNYNGEKIKEASRIEKPNSAPNYEAEVKGKDLLFDANGQFIKVDSKKK